MICIKNGTLHTAVSREPIKADLLIDNGKIANWQAVVPTTWNASPRDPEGNHGAFEASLIGTKLAKPEEPLEIIRTIHSFDPCLACATHVLDNKGEELVSVKVR